MASIAPTPKLQFLDNAGNPLVGGKLYTYAAGTTTPLATYTNAGGLTSNANPVILDSRGEADVWLGTSQYKFKLTTSTDVEVWTVDNLNAADAVTLAAALSGAAAAMAASNGSSLVGFIQPGTGAVATTVQTKLREWISVKDFGATGDGTTDDYTSIVNAINQAISTHKDVFFPAGTYRITSGLVVLNATDLKLFGDGSNSSLIVYDGSASSTTAVLALENCSYTNVDRLGLYGSPSTGVSKAGFGVYVTNSRTGAAAITQYNRFFNVRVGRYTDAGFQFGRHSANTDQNTDGNGCWDCFADGTNYNSTAYANVGARFEDSNTNFSHWIGGAIAQHSQASIEFAQYARNVTVDGCLVFNYFSTSGTGPSTGAHFWIRNNQSGPISLKNITTELYCESFLKADATSGGTVNYNLLSLENINCTANYGASGYAGTKVIDYQGTGSVRLSNCRFGGSLYDSGVPSGLFFAPVNAPQGGAQVLITQGVHLYDGAYLSVTTNTNSAYMSWNGEGLVDSSPLFMGSISGTTLTVTEVIQGASSLAVGSAIAYANGATGVTVKTKISALGTGSGGTGTYTVDKSQTVAYGKMVAHANADAPVFKLPNVSRRVNHDYQRLTDITLPSAARLVWAGHQGRSTWVVNIPYNVLIDAALTQAVYIATLPAKTQLVACYADTTTAFAGLAGTIQASVGTSAANNLLLIHDIKTAAVTKGLISADLGTSLATSIQGGMRVLNWTGAVQPYVTFTSGTGNLGNGSVTNLNAGMMTVYLVTETLP